MLQRLAIANFGGSGQNSIQAMATDSDGNVFVAGTTNSPDFPVKNAFQSALGEASVLRTTDLGNTWTRVPAPLDITAVFPDPVAQQILFGGGTAGIYKSADAGQTWQVVYPFSPGVWLQSLAIDPGNDLRIAATVSLGSGSLIRSLDGGVTWSQSPPSTSAGALVADPGGSGALVVYGTAAFISRDWGLTFNAIYPTGAMGFSSTIAFDPSHRGWIYMDVAGGVVGSLWLSTDFGATWTSKASPPPGSNAIMRLAVDPDIPTTLVAATPGGLYLSTDGAASWKPTSKVGDPFDVDESHPLFLVSRSCNPGGGLFAVGIGAGAGSFGIAFSPDYGVTWRTPQLTQVTGLAAGAGCAVYAARTAAANGADAFVAKLAPDGEVLWSTFLGGLDRDAPVGIAVDAQGNAYVAGTTFSSDFPSTIPRIGVAGLNSTFVTKFWPDGTLAYSVLIGGELTNNASGIAVDSAQNAYVTGGTNSVSFPVTPGAMVTQISPQTYTGFLVKLSATGAELVGTYLGPSYTQATSIVIAADQSPILAGTGGAPGLPAPPQGASPTFIMKLDRTASQVVSAAYIQGMTAGGAALLATAPDGNVVVVGQSNDSSLPTPGAYVSPPSSSECGDLNPVSFFLVGGLYIAKLDAQSWQPIYAALLNPPCGISPGAVAVDTSGAVVLGLSSGAGLPLRGPLLAGPACSLFTSAIAKLSPDGSTLQYATYLDDCGVPSLTLAADGSTLVGVSSRAGQAGVLRLNTANVSPLSLDSISNAFSGNSNAVVGGGLYTILGTGFQPPASDLGLNPSQDLPRQLGGVQVKFGGTPAAIARLAPGQVTVAVPEKLVLPGYEVSPHLKQDGRFTSVQLFYNGKASNTVLMPVQTFLPDLLTLSYPNPQPLQNADANARNQDGTMNDANHPAPAGSTIAIFATGLGATKPYTANPGAVSSSSSTAPVMPVYSSWQRFSLGFSAVPYSVSSVPGFVSAMFQIQVPVPTDISSLGGVDVGNGARRVSIGLRHGPPVPSPLAPLSNSVSVYVK
ncbi:MAG TPA: SBBP repeat-containing protein [Bryobacteraceae bacterium]